jgi:hypothetical protein
LLEEAWSEFVSVDGKVAATIRLLVTRPGALTREYLVGRRARFLPPLRLYLLCSVAFFLLEATKASTPRFNKRAPVTDVAKQTADSLAFARRLDSARASQRNWLVKRVKVNGMRVGHDGYNFTSDFQTQYPRLLFALMPAFAGLLMLVYRSRRRRFAAHLIVSLHLHAFFFATIALVVAASWIPDPARHVITYPLAAWFVFYIPAALKAVYGGRVMPTVLRTALVMTLYSVVVLLGMTAMAFLLLLFY